MTTLTKSWLQVGSFVYMETLAPPGTDKILALNKGPFYFCVPYAFAVTRLPRIAYLL
jgi:hypothetical protein